MLQIFYSITLTILLVFCFLFYKQELKNSSSFETFIPPQPYIYQEFNIEKFLGVTESYSNYKIFSNSELLEYASYDNSYNGYENVPFVEGGALKVEETNKSTNKHKNVNKKKKAHKRFKKQKTQKKLNKKSISDLEVRKLLKKAKKYLGATYVWGGNGYLGFDCSGFTKTMYGSLQVNLPRVACNQFSVGKPVPKSKARPGDLIFFSSSRKRIGHVGIILDPKKQLFIHASSGAKKVTISRYSKKYYAKRFKGIRSIRK